MVSRQLSPSYIPDRGHIVWLNLSPQAGHEMAGRRPALVLSPAWYNGNGRLMLCCPIRSRTKRFSFEVSLVSTSVVRGVVLVDQIRSVDYKARRAAYADTIGASEMQEVLQLAMRLLVDRPPAPVLRA